MNLKKQKAFNEKMGRGKKFPYHQNLAKGGIVKMASGGILGIPGALTVQNDYGAQMAPTQQSNYGNVISTAGQNALGGNQVTQGIVGQQLGLANQLQGVANGTGPNPAQTMLNTATGQNVANQASLMAGQRGGAGNVGLLAREAAMQGANTQQQAVGQGATLQSQQQLNALNAVGSQYQNAANANISQQNANTSLFGTGASAQNAQNNSNIANYGMAQGINAQIAQNNANAVNDEQQGMLQGISKSLPVVGGMFHAHGGMIQNFDNGGLIDPAQIIAEPEAPQINTPTIQGKLSQRSAQTKPEEKKQDTPLADSLKAPDVGSQFSSAAPNLGIEGLSSAPAAGPGLMDAGALVLAHGGQVYHPRYFHEYFSEGGSSGGQKALVSPKEVYLNPRQVKEVVERGADPIKIGHKFPGKDKVSKDSTKNDVIPTTLEEGGIVLPIHITTHKDASNRGRKFVEKTVAKHLKKPQGAR